MARKFRLEMTINMLLLEEAGVEAKRGGVSFDRDVSFVAGMAGVSVIDLLCI